jgi:hypothetical protein
MLVCTMHNSSSTIPGSTTDSSNLYQDIVGQITVIQDWV